MTSLNILTKAQIVMSTSVNDSIFTKYKKLMEEEKNGVFNLDKQKAALAGLHKHSINPEDLNSTNQETYLNFLKTEDINKYIAENELERQQAKDEITKLQTSAAEKDALANKALEALLEKENKNYRKSMRSK